MKHGILGMLLLLVCAVSVTAHAQPTKVITKENAVRESCRFYAPVKTKVFYNDVVDIISKEGDWFRVKYKGIEGCIHRSAVDEKKVSLSGTLEGSRGRGTSSDEVALAGKGFNPQVERSYKGKHPELDFGKVDRIERHKVPEKELWEFVRNGGLNLPQ